LPASSSSPIVYPTFPQSISAHNQSSSAANNNNTPAYKNYNNYSSTPSAYANPGSFQKAYENGNLRVENLLAAYDWSFKNNERLEETLRTEILNSEEQRSFIELLKNTLEKKMNAKK
jgi:hypothetical protein